MKVHFIGIGGIGMSALARYFLAQKNGFKGAISGSDRAASQITAELRKQGVRVQIGHKKGNLSANTDLAVVSQAIRPDNPEYKEARRLGVPLLTYPEVIAELTGQYKTIAVAGAHGKSTTTALAALILQKGGLDPTVIVGTNLKEFGGHNFRAGRGNYLVLEADEFGNAFQNYIPQIAVITNIDREHLDVYKTLGNVKRAFLQFIKNVAPGGGLVLNRDDQNLYSLRKEIRAIEKKNGLRVIWHSNKGTTAKKIRKVIQIPGEHNVSDALGAYKAGRILGIPHSRILAAIGSYHGAWRRMEYRGKFGGARGALIYDDYAHHPTEIKATLKAFHEKYPDKKLLCVFQPHQAKRLAALFKEFTSAFDDADKTLILPIYKVAGRDGRPSKQDAQALARAIQKKQPRKPLFYLPKPKNLLRAIKTLATPLSETVIVMMGAGNIVDQTDALLKSR